MSSSNIPPQSTFFYLGKWTAEVDTIFLSVVLHHKQTQGWENGDIPPAALRLVKQELNRHFGDIFSFDEIVERKVALENRYWTFKWVVDTEGVFWDVKNHCVHALPPIWNHILQMSEETHAYFYADEPEWNKLDMILRSDAMKVEKKNSLVVLSDSNEGPRRSLKHETVPQIEDEVTSPVFNDSGSKAKRLIANQRYPLDLESTNDGGDCYIIEDPTKNASFSLRNVVPSRMKETERKHTSKHSTSSCASSSPKKWYRNLFP